MHSALLWADDQDPTAEAVRQEYPGAVLRKRDDEGPVTPPSSRNSDREASRATMSSTDVAGPVGQPGITDERIVQCSYAFSIPTFVCRGSVNAGAPPSARSLLAQMPWVVPVAGTQKAKAIGGKLGRRRLRLSIAELTEIEAGTAQIQSPGVLCKKPPKP